ncbi:MAG: UDP-3-O-[3-hydroxymyristoyl] N-acetylglucosamine deacetylase [Kiritimatiellaeota bacterium]|nr:UDP-3-O-[3-hydroxymyristoyl] N-acetylglucosamine deacetylase [Kiritimatiellota bacterium]
MSTTSKQRTIKKTMSYSGIALHMGVRAHLAINPAPVDTGIIFKRVDLDGAPTVKASAENVVDVRRGTTIASRSGAAVSTVEHVMATLTANSIDNAIVDMDGPEPPIGDGSALPYSEMILEAGTVELDSEAEYFSPSKPIYIEEDYATSVLLPCDEFKITCMVDFKGTPLGTQLYAGTITEEEFAENIAPARTLCDYRDLEQLIAMGLVKGGSLDNAIVINDGAIISKEGLRFPDELVRHKVLDVIGDLSLIGKRLKAHVITVKPGHSTNVMLAKKALESIS